MKWKPATRGNSEVSVLLGRCVQGWWMGVSICHRFQRLQVQIQRHKVDFDILVLSLSQTLTLTLMPKLENLELMPKFNLKKTLKFDV